MAHWYFAREFRFRTKVVCSVAGLVLLTGGAILWLAYQSAHSNTTTLADKLFREVSDNAVSHTQHFVLSAKPLVESIQQLSGHTLSLGDSDRLAAQLLAFLRGNPGLSWVSYGDEKGNFTGAQRMADGKLRINQSRIVEGKTKLVEREVLSDGSWREVRRDDDSGYDPRSRPYYVAAKQSGKVTWSEPYVFFNQGVPGISCSAPIRDGAGELSGVVSVDFDLNALSMYVGQLSFSPNSQVFLFTSNEVVLALPHRGLVESQGVGGGKGELLKLRDLNDPLILKYAESLSREHFRANSGDGFYRCDFRVADGEYMASATTFRVGDNQTWVVGVIAPKADFLSSVWRSQSLALGFALGALACACLLAVVLAGHVSRPIHELIGFMRRVGAGDLEAKADLGGSLEFRELSIALNQMIAGLRDRLRLRHSLDLAMEVQQRLLPQSVPQVAGLEIAGHSTYCDETGGDYYDFLALDEALPGRLLVAIGDVMGHGVAAALVMAGVRAVLRDRATSGSLAELMGRLNKMIVSDQEGSRFMTMYLSVIDPQARTIRFVSAGHDPAILYDPATDQFEEIDAGNFPLGIMDTVVYDEHTYSNLRPGQVIVVGTDGVWEMQNGDGELFGKARLRELIRASGSRPAQEILEAIRKRLFEFRGDAQAIDDVTFLVVKVVPTTS